MRRQTNPITPHETWLNLFWSKLCIFCGLYFDFVLSPVFRRFVFLHLDTLPRSDFPGSHGAKKHYRLALFWARARQNFWCDFLQGKKVELFSLTRFWRRKQKNLSLTLRAREKIWSRLVGKSNINRKRLLTFLNGAISHPRRPRSSQSGREKRRDESFQVRAKEARMQPPDWAQTMLCIIVHNRRTVSPEFFSWVRTRRLLSRHTCPVRSPSLCVQGKLLFSAFITRNKGTFGMLSAGAIQFAPRIFCFWLITIYRK